MIFISIDEFEKGRIRVEILSENSHFSRTTWIYEKHEDSTRLELANRICSDLESIVIDEMPNFNA